MVTKLKDIASILSGTYQQEVPDGDLLYLQVKDFTASHLSKGELSPTVLKESRMTKHILQHNDLLFAAKGVSNFCIVYKEEMGEAIASTSFFVIRITTAAIMPEYLCWYINTPPTLKALQSKAMGSSVPSISKEILMDWEISIPDIKRQHTIVECADLQSKAYQLEQHIIEKKKQLYLQTLLNATK